VVGELADSSIYERGIDLAFDTSVAHPARVYDYWLGGKDNFAADRAVGEQTLRAHPDLTLSVRANRAFLARAVRYLVREAGIRQFLDIGTGIPTANNTHEVAQATVPECRIVCVDNDPIVLCHARALLTSTPQGATDYVDADLRDPGTALAAAANTLDFSRPVAIMLLAILQFISDEDDPYWLVTRLMEEVAPGSYLAISHPTADLNSALAADSIRRYNEQVVAKATLRTRDQTSLFFDGLNLVEPGVVPVSQWRPDNEQEAASPATLWAGVGRKA
jgi:trans-aconitate methyltransferase